MNPRAPAPASRKLRYGVPMAPRTTWRVGGIADCFFAPRSLEELSLFLAEGEVAEPLTWVGHGSNLLIRDGGLPGTVVCTRTGPKGLKQLDAVTVRAEAGVSSARVARFCAQAGLAGAEFLAGIPGAIGGALAMNAGAYGTEVADILVAAELIDDRGRIRAVRPEELAFAYRHSGCPQREWFVAGHFSLASGDPKEIWAHTRELLHQREVTQPVHRANAGSVFRNPPGNFAARLIEASGLKGERIGGAEVSKHHANFIVNRGGARAADIEALIERIRSRVWEHSGVGLELEVQIVGCGP